MTSPLRKSAVALAVLCALPSTTWAQSIALRGETTITGVPDPKTGVPAPIYLEAERVQGYAERETEASGNARARSRGQLFAADWMRFDHSLNEITAIGNVHFEQGAYIVDGLRLRYDLDSERGVMEDTRYALNPRATGNLPIAGEAGKPASSFTGRGTAQRILFEGPGQFHAQQANFTTCEPSDNSWSIRAQDLRIYQEKGVGEARGATVEIGDVPVFYSPYFSFPLHQERKSGFLAPRYGSSSNSGLEFSVPYFWNMAPNYDLTITPRVLAKRGLQIRNDFRYLQPDYRGEVHYEVLPSDRVFDGTRQLFTLKHTQTLWNGWGGTVDINKVSDSKYFTDMSTTVALTSQTFLTRQGTVARSGTWGGNGLYSLSGTVQRWQTLQTDPLVPLIPPYSRQPQLSFAAQNYDTLGGQFDLQSSFVAFGHPTLTTGKRLVAYPSLTFPFQSPGVFFSPKIGVHMSRYWIDPNTASFSSTTRVVPIITATGGIVLERDTNIFSKDYTQTLEPKAYYVYIPNRNQSMIPNFDSGLMDINFATIFSENQFSGQDRINDANQLTLGATTRLISRGAGLGEMVRAAIAQRYYFRAQDVTLPDVPPRNNQSSRSDLLAALSGVIAPHLTTDLGWQYNTDTRQTKRSNISLRYAPALGKVVSFTYRQNSATAVRQFDISGQWPIAQNWTAVSRWNYSVPDRRMLEGLAGMEYDGGCYKIRFVGHRLSTSTTASNTAIFLELELNGVTRVGSNSLDLLRRNVSGYTRDTRTGGRQDEYYVPER